MFAKTSRYRRLPEATTLDTRGFLRTVAETRPLPAVDGVLSHNLAEGDRLDALAHYYYEESTLWWNICDANRDFLSPLALMDLEPFVTARIPLTITCGALANQDEALLHPPWSELLHGYDKGANHPESFGGLLAMAGIEDVVVEETPKDEGSLESRYLNEQALTCDPAHFDLSVMVTFNKLSVDFKTIMDDIKKGGFNPGQPEFRSRIGQGIAIPSELLE